MTSSERIKVDMRAAVNAVSDVVANRTRPLREFDQIHMKTGDMVMQSEAIAAWANNKRLAFIGDGDAVSVALAYLKERGVLDFGPTKIMVFDFAERTVNAVKRFADKERLDYLDAELYNVLDPFPATQKYDCFYTNPPWGASNDGESVNAFLQRGIEAVQYGGEGCVVIADDDELESVESQWYPPSVHLDRRLQGSVCLTPTTCTSWGPPDDDFDFSPISNGVHV